MLSNASYTIVLIRQSIVFYVRTYVSFVRLISTLALGLETYRVKTHYSSQISRTILAKGSTTRLLGKEACYYVDCRYSTCDGKCS